MLSANKDMRQGQQADSLVLFVLPDVVAAQGEKRGKARVGAPQFMRDRWRLTENRAPIQPSAALESKRAPATSGSGGES